MDSVFYIPETHGLHIPLLGEINVVKWLLIAAAVVAVYSFIPNLAGLAASKAASFVVSLLKQLFEGFKSGLKTAEQKAAEKTPTESKQINSESKSDAMSNLQGLTEWAVDTGDPEVLDKVTPLFKELQKKASAAVILACLVIAGCSSTAEPQDVKNRFGWVGPAPETNAQSQNQSLRHQAPQYFGK
jgi:mannitol-specific phosphotransferase system IIBC component